MDASEAALLDSSRFMFPASNRCRYRKGPDGEWVWPITLVDCGTYRCLSVVRAASHDEHEELMKLQTMMPDEVQAYLEAKDDDDPFHEDPFHEDKSWAATGRLVRPLMDRLPPDVVGIDIDQSGNLLWTSTDVMHDAAWSTYYPSVIEYRLRRPVPTLLRSQLAVVERLAFGVDQVVHAQYGSAGPARDDGEAAVVVKYNTTGGDRGDV